MTTAFKFLYLLPPVPLSEGLAADIRHRMEDQGLEAMSLSQLEAIYSGWFHDDHRGTKDYAQLVAKMLRLGNEVSYLRARYGDLVLMVDRVAEPTKTAQEGTEPS